MKLLQICTLLLLLAGGIGVFTLLPSPVVVSREVDTSWVVVAENMGIQNMVTAVYLGPRMVDTFMEVMVVVLTVFGMKFVREKT